MVKLMETLTEGAGPVCQASRWVRDQALMRLPASAAACSQEPPDVDCALSPQTGEVLVVQTSKAGGFWKSAAPLQLEQSALLSNHLPVVLLDAKQRYQTFMGFGGAFTESSAQLPMNMEMRQKVARAYYSPNGLGYRFGRLHMNSCDFSEGRWSCCETPGDFDLETFSVERYERAIIPMIRLAMRCMPSGTLHLLASPWSPPAWMKDGGVMCGGKLRADCRQAWARHYVRFAEEFAARDLPLWGFTVQNEPEHSGDWECCTYTAEEERNFVRDHLGPALEGSGVKLMIWDHNLDVIDERLTTVLSDAASRYVWGSAFHWYGDPRYEFWPPWNRNTFLRHRRQLQTVHDKWPDKHLVFTEGCQEKGPRIGDWRLGERYAENIINHLNQWTVAWIDWNLVLDERGGPNHTGNFCSAPIIYDTRVQQLLFLSSYYYIGHFSRYIMEGAVRIGCSTQADLDVVAFANPDGTLVAIVLNSRDTSLMFLLDFGGVAAVVLVPAHSITTFAALLPTGL
mmetsp:Transcript_42573/g.112342  ORF Transcript_42573/g.112342 Transcript_42573/m.112342 type:complete len:511 (-) Transcript_42573:86-1618(-)